MQITETAVRRPIATAMVFLIVIVLGVMGFRFLPVDLLPPIEYPQLTVATNYPNVGPEEIERIITDEVENALAGVPNVEEIRSGSSEGRSRVTLEFTQGTNVDAAADVQEALRRENVTLPGGDMREGLRDMYVRTQGEFQSLDQIADTIVTMVDGRPIRVRDVAEVVDGYEDVSRLVQIDGRPMVRMGVRKQSGANTVAVAAEAREVMQRINAERDDIELMMIIDQSDFIQNSIDNVQKAALWGGLLAILVLYVFLHNGSTTFIIALSIPISLIATFALLYFNGLTLNQMSFGGLALGIGLIVDNAIVVLENIVRQRERGRPLDESALVGTRQVSGAIIASTLTTSVIFLPVLFMQTISGMLFRELALVVVFALLCSLLVALTLVPMLSSRMLTVGATGTVGAQAVRHRRVGAWFNRVENAYAGGMQHVVRHKIVVFGLTLALLAGAIYLWPLLPVELAPQTDADEIDVELEMAQGTNIAVVNEYLHELERLVQEATPMDQVKNMTIEIRPGDAEVELALLGADERDTDSYLIADEIRRRVQGRIPGADIRVRAQSGLWMLRRLFGSGDGSAVQLELRGYDLELADRIAKDIVQVMQGIPEVADARVSRREGRPEQNLIIDRDKVANLGMSVREIAEIVQTNVGGGRASVFREGGEEFPITVRLQAEDRLTTQDLANVSVRSANGQTMPVSSVVETERRRSPTDIDRVDGQRVTYITANLESGAALGNVIEDLRGRLRDMTLPSGFSILYGGEYEERQEARRDFLLSIAMAVILIYMVMAAQFERFLDPLIVMLSVPMALVGVVPTLLLTGTSLNVQSLMGIVMLIGIVVNNAIVLVDYINLMRREQELGVRDAVLEAARLRLRPILMTTLTTLLGMLPLAIGGGAGGEIQASLARAVIGGLTVSTLITLVVIPTAYIGIHQLRGQARA